MDKQLLINAVNQVMPYGKYSGRKLIELPEPYLVWMHSKGFDDTPLGRQLALIYEVKLNGLEGMLKPLIKWAEPGLNKIMATHISALPLQGKV